MSPLPSNPSPLTLAHPRPVLACKIAGALAQAAIKALTLQAPGGQPQPLTARTTDLPALLRDAPAGTRLTTPDGCVIELGGDACTINNPGRALVQAIARISR